MKVGDTLGVCFQSDKSLHFYYKGIDLGPAATGLSGPLYGVVDVYGQAVQATMVDVTVNTGWFVVLVEQENLQNLQQRLILVNAILKY